MALKSGDVKRVFDVFNFTPQTAGATNLLAPIETLGYTSVEFQITGGTTPVATVSISNDNVNYSAVSLIDRQSLTPATRVATATVVNGFYALQFKAQWVKIVLTSIAGGTTTGQAIFSSEISVA